MARDPAALQLRLLQTVVEVAGEQNGTLVMPVPVELLRFFEKMTPAGPGAELSPSLADFGDAEARRPRPPSRAARPLPGLTPYRRPRRSPYRRWRHRTSRLPRSPRTPSKPNGRRRRLQGPWRTRAARPGIRCRVDAPQARGVIRPDSAPPPEAAATAVLEPACTTVPISAEQRSSAQRRASRTGPGSFSAGGDSPVSAGSSHSSPAVPGEWYRCPWP